METHEQARLKQAKEQAEATAKMLKTWATKQGTSILKQMELKGSRATLSLHWKWIKDGWMGGFVSGVATGFDLGFKASTKLKELDAKFLDQSKAILSEPGPDTRVECVGCGQGGECIGGANCISNPREVVEPQESLPGIV